MKKKILFYDCFTKGVGHVISPINRLLPKNKFQSKLLHFESIYDAHFPKYVKKEGLTCYDFSYYQTYNIKKILEKENPDLVIFFDKGGLMDRTGIKAAKFLKIPTLYIQHGMLPLVEEEAFLRNIYSLPFYLRNFKRIFKTFVIYFLTSLAMDNFFLLRPKTHHLFLHLLTNPYKFYFTYPDEVKINKLAVYGKVDKEFFQKKDGYKDEEIEVTGSPFLDKTCLIKKITQEEAKRKLRIASAKKVALFLSQPLFEDFPALVKRENYENFLKKIFKASKNSDLVLVIKLHPREEGKIYKNLFKNKPGVQIVRGDLDFLIKASDLVLGFNSTALFNAVILEKPIIICDLLPNFRIEEHFSAYRVAVKVKKKGELEEAIKIAMREKPSITYMAMREQFIRRFLYKDDGRAMERIRRLVVEMV